MNQLDIPPPQLPDDVLSVLKRAGEAPLMPAADIGARSFDALSATLGAGMSTTIGAQTIGAVAASSAAATGATVVVTKASIVGGLVLAAMVGAGVGVTTDRATNKSTRDFDKPTRVAAVAPRAAAPPPVPQVPAVDAGATIEPVAALPTVDDRPNAVSTSNKATKAVADVSPQERLTLERMRVALSRGAFADANAALVELRKHFAHGALVEEREGLAVLLAYRSNDARAATQYAAFAKRYPRSTWLKPIDAESKR